MLRLFCVLFFVQLVCQSFCMMAALSLTEADDIDTNRPSFTASPLVVPSGALQFENGTLYQHFQHGTNYFDIPETEVRLGLTKKTELQMFVPSWTVLHNENANQAIQGVSNLSDVGFKREFGPFFKDLYLSAIGAVNIPTGRREISTNGVQPIVRMPWRKDINQYWSATGMQSVLVVNAGRDVQWQNFWCLNRSFSARRSIFAEYAGFYTHQRAPINIMHFGLVQKLNKNNQVDLQFGFGLNKTAPAAFVGVGYSLRLDRLPILSKL